MSLLYRLRRGVEGPWWWMWKTREASHWEPPITLRVLELNAERAPTRSIGYTTFLVFHFGAHKLQGTAPLSSCVYRDSENPKLYLFISLAT